MSEIGSGSGSSYPTALDTDASQEVNTTSPLRTMARAEVVNDLASALLSIETELGLSPSGSYTDVSSFLLDIEEAVLLLEIDMGFMENAISTLDNVVRDMKSATLGAWLSRSANTSYRAESNGFVCAGGNGNAAVLTISTDGSKPPTTIRARMKTDAVASSQ